MDRDARVGARRARSDRERAARCASSPSRGRDRARSVSEVSVCGLCRTDLHVVEGELAPVRPAVVPGHQIVGRVSARGGASRFALGARVGVAWLWRACGACVLRARRRELCRAPTFTGWHVDGGYAERVCAP